MGSRSGRKNSPRIDYKTGATLTADGSWKGASPYLSKARKTPDRKRSNALVSPSSTPSSSSASPKTKKKFGEAVEKSSKAAGKKNMVEDLSDIFVENTPPSRAKRSQSSTASATFGSTRSGRLTRK